MKFSYLNRVRKNSPLVVNLTNYVAAPLQADLLLAIGASPIMSWERNDLKDLIPIAHAGLINIGTFEQRLRPDLEFAISWFNQHQTPTVLDPVGCGASSFRTELSRFILNSLKNIVIKGNASEIISLGRKTKNNRGVDSSRSSHEAIDTALELVSLDQVMAVVVTGKTDYCVSQKEVSEHAGGTQLMTKVTGTGCSLGSILAAFIGQDSSVCSIKEALDLYNLCSSQAEKISRKLGHFKAELINQLGQIGL